MALEAVQTHLQRTRRSRLCTPPACFHSYWPNKGQARTLHARVAAPQAQISGDARGRARRDRCPRRATATTPGLCSTLSPLCSPRRSAARFPIAHADRWTARTRRRHRYEYVQPPSPLSFHLLSFKRFLFSTFLPRAVTPGLPPVLPPRGRRFISKRQHKKKKIIYLRCLLLPTSCCSSSLPKPSTTCLQPSYTCEQCSSRGVDAAHAERLLPPRSDARNSYVHAHPPARGVRYSKGNAKSEQTNNQHTKVKKKKNKENKTKKPPNLKQN